MKIQSVQALVLTAVTMWCMVTMTSSMVGTDLIQPDACSQFIQHDCVKKEKRRLTGRIICVNDTDEMLVKRLKDIGGYNPRYVAANIFDALNFEDPSQFYFTSTTTQARKKPPVVGFCGKGPYPRGHPCYRPTKPTQAPPTTTPKATTPRRTTPTASTPARTTPRVVVPQRKRRSLRDEGWARLLRLKWPLDDLKQFSKASSAHHGRQKRMAAIGSRGCWEKGTQVEGQSRYYMCSTCHVVTPLPDNQFPRLLNEAICRHMLPANLGPVPGEAVCVANAGNCAQKVIKMSGLIQDGYVKDDAMTALLGDGKVAYTQKWNETTLEIRSCCECEISLPAKSILELANSQTP